MHNETEVKVVVTHGGGITETYLMDISGVVFTTTTDFLGNQTLVLQGDFINRQIEEPREG